ncbi:hypothetical protein K1719_029251 [Acacia pycnantha]|nr:hypothetical protein K1719_029251 [Acacia pycnantha]
MESTKRPSFLEEDRGLASASDMEAGFSGCNSHYHYYQYGFVSRSMGYATSFYRSSSRNLSVFPPRSGRFYDARFEDHQPYFLEACFLCKKPLKDDRDIFMYRGDIPFCSVECRQEQIELDEAKEKNRNLSSSMKALRKKDQNRSTSPNKGQDYPFRTGTVAAA